MTLRLGLLALLLTGPLTIQDPARADARRSELLALVPFDHSAFPYTGAIPEQDKPFLDVTENGRHGHTSPRGGILWEDQTYSDKRSLLVIPPTFDRRKPAALILFFHGNRATLARDVSKRQGVPRQLVSSKLNAILVAPQMAVDALDSSAGHFYEPGFLDAYLDEAADRFATLSAGRLKREDVVDLPVIVVAYSGGYLPAAFSLTRSETHRRIIGVILLDALFGEADKFETWILRSGADAFFLSAYSKASSAQNMALEARLAARGLPPQTAPAQRLSAGSLVFIAARSTTHDDFVTEAWTQDPLAAALGQVALPTPSAGR